MRTTTTASRTPATIARQTGGIIRSAELRASGVPSSTISARCRPGGPWRRLLPGVILLGDAEPTRGQLVRAALCQLGDTAVVTGPDALRAHGLVVPLPHSVHLLVPPAKRARSDGRTVLERTARLPQPLSFGGLPIAGLVRAVTDTTRRFGDPGWIIELLQRVVASGRCSVDELRAELEAGNQRGSAGVRLALRGLETPDGTRALARRVIERAGLPAPVWDVVVCDRRGRSIGHVDAWWEEAGFAWRVRTEGQATERAEHRERLAMTAAGIVVVSTRAEQLTSEGTARELVSGLRAAGRQPRSRVRIAPAGATGSARPVRVGATSTR